ncbi:putative alpha-xylosidase 2 [Malus sylvestris]|uniref:putative alpha-xylosidase 2 n=1 Tax=Malus sylvestris TaxID=3752 RepID=UPI0021AD13ED|nr:putative alpha-xylosidase 2 [Malus sylvestris]
MKISIRGTTFILGSKSNLAGKHLKSPSICRSDYPGDTFLPGMKLGVNRSDGHIWALVSYVDTYNPAPGPFSLVWDPNEHELKINKAERFIGLVLVFKDQYLEISTRLPKDSSLYGLGENSQPHGIKLYPNDPYILFTTDVSAINLNTDLYGSHPVYMDLWNVGNEAYAHSVLLLNNNGMDVFYRGNSLTYKVIGGGFDFYFFAAPTPLGVVDQYTAFIGRPAPMA